MMERFTSVLAIAGVGCFLLAGVVEGYLPFSHLNRIRVRTLDEIAPRPSREFQELARRHPASFQAAYGTSRPTKAAFHRALRSGRDVYVAEACWHCHSQFVRPVSNEDVRFGPVSTAFEYQNEMNLPHLFGTRRIGPDLIRENGRRSIDWHVAHFYDPQSIVPASVMPRYDWFFDADGRPNEKGLSVITYVSWLGTTRGTGREQPARTAARSGRGAR